MIYFLSRHNISINNEENQYLKRGLQLDFYNGLLIIRLLKFVLYGVDMEKVGIEKSHPPFVSLTEEQWVRA